MNLSTNRQMCPYLNTYVLLHGILQMYNLKTSLFLQVLSTSLKQVPRMLFLQVLSTSFKQVPRMPAIYLLYIIISLPLMILANQNVNNRGVGDNNRIK